MNAPLDPQTDLTDRLHALGAQPVDPSLQSQHLTAMAGVRGGSVFRTALATRLKIGAGVAAGFLLGATGLTTVGAMGPLQTIAADVVEAVAPVDVPKGKSDQAKADAAAAKAARGEREDGEKGESRLADGSIGTPRIWTNCVPGTDGDFAGNRGQYLKQERAKSDAALTAAKATDCGKPIADDEVEGTEAPEGDDEGSGKATAPGQQNKADKTEDGDDADKARPADAGKPTDPGSQGNKPESVPTVPDQAADEADPPVHAPGEPAEPENTGGQAEL